jgi:hypothetical protein
MNASLRVLSDLTGLKINLSTHTAMHVFTTSVLYCKMMFQYKLGINNIIATQIYTKLLNTKI